MTCPFVMTSYATHDADWDMGYHAHDSFEVSIVLEGGAVFEVQDTAWTLRAGHVVMIPADVSHRFLSQSGIRFGVLQAGQMPRETMDLVRRFIPSQQPAVLRLSPSALEEYEGLFRQWLRMISTPLQEKERVIVAWVDLLLLFLLQHQNKAASDFTVLTSADHIRSNLRSELSIGDLAKQCGLSVSAYRAMFKEAFGVSPKQYQQSCRDTEAKWMLRTTDRPIQFIAQHVGFSSLHSFSAWFQKNEGMSASDWRKIQQGQLGAGDGNKSF